MTRKLELEFIIISIILKACFAVSQTMMLLLFSTKSYFLYILILLFFIHQIDILRGSKVDAYTLDMSAIIAGNLYEEGCKMLPATLIPSMQGRQRQLKTTIDTMQTEYQKLQTRCFFVIFNGLRICFNEFLLFRIIISNISLRYAHLKLQKIRLT